MISQELREQIKLDQARQKERLRKRDDYRRKLETKEESRDEKRTT